MKQLAVAACVLVLLLGGGIALAQEAPPRPPQDLHWNESPIWGSWGFNAGLMFFNSQQFREIYGNRGMVFYNMNAGLKLVYQLEVLGSIGYGFSEGRGIAPESGQKTDEWYKLHYAPASLGLTYRFGYVLDQPVVPYLGVQGAFAYWMEEREHSGTKRRGYLYGMFGTAGVMFLLDKLEPRAAGELESSWGINHSYFYYEYRYSYMDDFGKKDIIDLSSQFHSFGIAFEF
jgi:hypothetical protein